MEENCQDPPQDVFLSASQRGELKNCESACNIPDSILSKLLITNKIYFRFVDPKITQEALRKRLSQFGKVRQFYLCNNFKDSSFVYGFAKFNSVDLALKLLDK